MFDFNKYPELKKYHKEDKKLTNALYKAETKHDRSGNAKDNNVWEVACKALEEFEILYAEKVFDLLCMEKPNLYNLKTKSCEQWDSVIKSQESKPITWIISLIEEDGGRYRLPPEYYK